MHSPTTDDVFLHFSSTLVIFCPFDNSHPNRCEVGYSFLWFWFAFPWWWIMFEHLFIYVLIICMSFEKCLFRSPPTLFFKLRMFCFCFCCQVVWVPYTFWTLIPYQICCLQKYFLPSVGCFFTLFFLLCTCCLTQVHLSIFIWCLHFWCHKQKIIAKINVKKLSSVFSSSSFTV